MSNYYEVPKYEQCACTACDRQKVIDFFRRLIPWKIKDFFDYVIRYWTHHQLISVSKSKYLLSKGDKWHHISLWYHKETDSHGLRISDVYINGHRQTSRSTREQDSLRLYLGLREEENEQVVYIEEENDE